MGATRHTVALQWKSVKTINCSTRGAQTGTTEPTPECTFHNRLNSESFVPEQSADFLAREILGLTKMNWNNTQVDGKYPITLSCARKVGEIMKYLEEHDHPQIRYGYYM